MDRQIKFRGKRLENGNPTEEWVYGSLRCYYGGIDSDSLFKHDPDPEMYSVGIRACEIFDPKTRNTYAVNPGTVGQFTGLRDKNGIEIYDGDIISLRDYVAEVRWNNNISTFCIRFSFESESDVKPLGSWINGRRSCIVIGNVFDNLELLDAK